MAPVIWGLDLREITWAKFGNANMWSNRYHLRRTKITVYQLAMIFCVVSESCGTAAMTDYLDQKEWIAQLDGSAIEHVQDYVGAASYNIFAGVFVAFVFGAAFFFDLIWPERHESRSVRAAWRVCSILATLFHVGAAFALTIVTARGTARFTGVDRDREGFLLNHAKKVPLRYKDYGKAIAAVVFIWPGTIFVIASAIIMWLSLANEDKYGTTVAAHERDLREKPVEGDTSSPAQQQTIRMGPDFESAAAFAMEDIRHSDRSSSAHEPAPHSGAARSEAQPHLFA